MTYKDISLEALRRIYEHELWHVSFAGRMQWVAFQTECIIACSPNTSQIEAWRLAEAWKRLEAESNKLDSSDKEKNQKPKNFRCWM